MHHLYSVDNTFLLKFLVITPSLMLSCQRHNISFNILGLCIKMKFFRDWIFSSNRSSANAKQLSKNLMEVCHYWFPARNGSWLHSHRVNYDWQQLPCTWVPHHTILWFKQGFNGRRHFTVGKSLRFTIPNSKSE